METYRWRRDRMVQQIERAVQHSRRRGQAENGAATSNILTTS